MYFIQCLKLHVFEMIFGFGNLSEDVTIDYVDNEFKGENCSVFSLSDKLRLYCFYYPFFTNMLKWLLWHINLKVLKFPIT